MADADDFSQYEESSAPAADDFAQFEDKGTSAGTGPSATEAAGRGFANSASLGTGKWFNALAEESGIPAGAAELIGGSTNPGMNRWQSAFAQLLPNTGNGKSFWQDITGSVEQQKAQNAEAANAHPIAYVAGAAAPAVITGAAGLARGGMVAASQLPSTLAGQTAVGAGLGAVSGASEGTNLHDAAGGAATGAVLGGALSLGVSGVIKGVSTLAKSYGTSQIKSTISNLIDAANSSDDGKSIPAVTKLRDLFQPRDEFGQPTGGNIADRQVLAQATAALNAVKGTAKGSMQNFIQQSTAQGIARDLAPTWGQIAGESGKAVALGALGGAAADYIPGAGPGLKMIGAAVGAQGPARAAVRDIGAKAAMNYAVASSAQNGVSALAGGAPTALGPISGQLGAPLGLSGMLGNYIDQAWSNNK